MRQQLDVPDLDVSFDARRLAQTIYFCWSQFGVIQDVPSFLEDYALVFGEKHKDVLNAFANLQEERLIDYALPVKND